MDARQASRTEPLAQTEPAEYECRACAGGPSTKRGPRSERGTRSVGKRWQRLRLTQTVTHHLARTTAEARHPPRDWRPDGRGQRPEQPRQLLGLARSGSLPRPRTSTRRSSSPARSVTRRGEGETLAHPRRHPPRTLAARRCRRTRASPSGRARRRRNPTRPRARRRSTATQTPTRPVLPPGRRSRSPRVLKHDRSQCFGHSSGQRRCARRPPSVTTVATTAATPTHSCDLRRHTR